MKEIILDIRNLHIYKKKDCLINDVSLSFYKEKITALLGVSGSGKTALVKSLNRLSELDPEIRVEGEILFKGQNVTEIPAPFLRSKIGLIFKQPILFPNMNIYQNVIAGFVLNSIRKSKQELDMIVQQCLKKVDLWESFCTLLYEGCDILNDEEAQKLCIARALALNPDVLIFDEPMSLLDPVASLNIEQVLSKLKKSITIIIVTHDKNLAGRIAQYCAYIKDGELVEVNKTDRLFTNPHDLRTENFLTSSF